MSGHGYRRLVIALAVCWGLGVWTVMAQEPVEDAAAYEQLQNYRFSLVKIPVWVANHKGVERANLEKQDFQVLVDDREVKIEDCLLAFNRPMELIYLLDISGSMAIGGKLQGSIDTISYLVGQHRPEDRFKVVAFADGSFVEVVNQDDYFRWNVLRAKLRAYGQTALYDTLADSNRFFGDASLHNRAIILFTDGNDTQSRLSREQFFTLLKILDVPVFIVGIADGFIPSEKRGEAKQDLKTLAEITKITGGKLFMARDASALPQIAETLKTKLRPQYLLTMMVERGQNDKRHDIEVKVRHNPALRVRFRRGYIGSIPEYSGGN